MPEEQAEVVEEKGRWWKLTKFMVSAIGLGFVLLCTVAGLSIAPYLTPLGLLLNTRWLLQIFFAYKNDSRFITALGRAIIDGFYRLDPNMSDEERAYLESFVGRHIEIDEFLTAIYKVSIAQTPRFTARLQRAIIKNLSEVKDEDGKTKYDVNRAADITIPGYGLPSAEMIETLEALLDQTMPAATIMPIVNDPKNKELIEGITKWVEEKRLQAQIKYESGIISSHLYGIELKRIRKVILKIADKRTAMAAGWLSTHGVPEEQLEPMIDAMFDHPEREVLLPPPSSGISVNLDSDTLPHRWALFLTYLCFVLFDLSGLTSNVRIKNMPKTLFADPLKTWWQNIIAFFLLWMTYFRYDEANNKERNAESWFFCVVCMSGPWMAIKSSLIGKFIGSFVNFKYNGARIRQGDDRYTTYKINEMGGRVAYCRWVVTYTDAPDTIKRFLAQQGRWIVSLYAIFNTSIKTGQILTLNLWSMLDQFYAAGFAFVMAGVLLRLIYNASVVALVDGTRAAAQVVLPYIIVFLVVNFLRGAWSAWTNKTWLGFLNSGYFIPVMGLLFPKKVWILFVEGLVPDPKKPQEWAGRAEAK